VTFWKKKHKKIKQYMGEFGDSTGIVFSDFTAKNWVGCIYATAKTGYMGYCHPTII